MSASSLFSVRLRYHNFVLTNCWAMIVQVSEGSSGNTMCQFLRWSLADENIDMGHACCQRSAKAHDICNNSDYKFRIFFVSMPFFTFRVRQEVPDFFVNGRVF